MVNNTTRLLGLDGLVAERVELDAAGVPVVDLSTGCEQARCCPRCGQRALRVKQWTTTRPRDLPVAGRTVRRSAKQRHCPHHLGTRPVRGPIATSFSVLAAWVTVDADRALFGAEQADSSAAGIAIAATSVFVMRLPVLGQAAP